MLLEADLVQPLRDKFKRLGYTAATAGAGQPLRKILMVGATTDDSGALSVADGAYLAGAADGMAGEGITLAPDFEISVANIDPHFGGEDFLTGKFAADMVVLCMVFDEIDGDGREKQGPCASSPHHSARNAWHDAAANTGARVVVAVGGPTEINGDHIAIDGGKFRTLYESYPESVFVSREAMPVPAQA